VVSLKQLLNEQTRLRFIFTGGKGGVGKTVAAAGLAYALTGGGRKTLIASLNPVHSLTSVFSQNVSGGEIKPVRGVEGLYAVEVEIHEAVEKYRENVGQRVKEFLKWADIPVDARPFVNIAVTNPAFEESAMFDRMIDIMLTEGQNYDHIIFDTAAVANAVRLIGLSKIYGLWLSRMVESRKEALSMKVQLSFRKEKMMEEVRKDPLMSDLMSMNDRFKQVKQILVDPHQTAFFFVTLPLSLPISVVKRFIVMVQAYNIPVGGVIVNQVLRSESLGGGKDEYLENRFVEQENYMKTIKQDLGPVVCAFVPLYLREVVGIEQTKILARDLMEFVPESWERL
jgi:arsenite-transporting ATPase